MFCFSQPVLYRPRTQTRDTRFQNKLELLPNSVPIELSQVAVPIIVLPQDDRTDSAQEEQQGLPYWTMISAIGVLVDVSKYLDSMTSEFLKNDGASGILSWV